MTIEDFLARLDGVRPRGQGKYMARCPAHQDRDPSLSVSDGDQGILVQCWAGCELSAIADKLGIHIKDLFYDRLSDPRQRREAVERRTQKLAAQQAAHQARGRKNDMLRQAQYLIQSACGVNIDAWSHEELDKRLNLLADAYEVLWREYLEQG